MTSKTENKRRGITFFQAATGIDELDYEAASTPKKR